ncbi:MAG: ABC transporter ATP-binding protein [Halopseudomonas sp.]
MIELQNLTKSYRLTNGERSYIFRDLNFTFPEKTNIGLIGSNGAGKSTLLRLIGGIDTPDCGRVVTDKRISWPVGLSGGLHATLTGRDSVKFVCRIYGALGDQMREKIAFVENFAELGDYFDQPVKSYSSGMRARLNFGMSWTFDFDYYLMDEIGAVGDARFKEKSRKLMEDRIGQSNVILVTHQMNEIVRICQTVVLVNNGQAILFQDVKEGINAYEEQANISPQKRLRTEAVLARRQGRPGIPGKKGGGRVANRKAKKFAEQTTLDTDS